MSKLKQPGEVAGQGPCPNCDRIGQYQVNVKRHLYFYCSHPAEGGCLTSVMSRSAAGDLRLAKRIRSWKSQVLKDQFLSGAPGPAPAPEDPPADDPVEDPPVDDPQDPPPPDPPKPAPVRRPPPRQPARKSFWETEL